MKKFLRIIPLVILFTGLILFMVKCGSDNDFHNSTMNVFEKIISLFFPAVITLVILVFLGWLYLVKLYPLTGTQWKKADFVWLGLTAIGLIGSVSENRRLFAERDLFLCDIRMKNISENLQRDFNDPYLCRVFNRDDSNAERLDSLQPQFDKMCQWAAITGPIVKSLTDNHRIILPDTLQFPNHITDATLTYYIDIINSNVSNYNEYAENRPQYLVNKEKDDLETTMKILAPFILMLGLSIRFTKTLGELDIQRKKDVEK